mmetsp:Transcript_12224/g.35358  ORF Transcript_12224/g.35358 Transcript_12224/m.35358 type:complete len:221 (-) Transcript_12224:512-1174(-)
MPAAGLQRMKIGLSGQSSTGGRLSSAFSHSFAQRAASDAARSSSAAPAPTAVVASRATFWTRTVGQGPAVCWPSPSKASGGRARGAIRSSKASPSLSVDHGPESWRVEAMTVQVSMARNPATATSKAFAEGDSESVDRKIEDEQHSSSTGPSRSPRSWISWTHEGCSEVADENRDVRWVSATPVAIVAAWDCRNCEHWEDSCDRASIIFPSFPAPASWFA